MTVKASNKPLIDIVDMQVDFIDPAGRLPIAGAMAIVPAFNAFLKELRADDARAILVKYDTHFAGEYPLSPESAAFPNIHCEWNSKGQRALIETNNLAVPVFHMNKNEFNMWGQNPTDINRIPFTDAAERQGYLNLFKVTPSFNDLTPGTPRDEWLARQGVTAQTPVVMAGVASDYCVLDAMKGYIDKGHPVTILTDLTAGIGGDASRGASGKIEDVCAQNFPAAMQSGQLRLMTSRQYLARNIAMQ